MKYEAQARAALKQGDLNSAIAAARAVIAADPANPDGYFLLGMAAVEADQVAQALPLLQNAVDRGPKAEHLAQLARLLILVRRDGEAADAARQAMALAPPDALTCDTIGCVLARLGDHEASVAPFLQAVAAEPDNREFRYNLAAACGFTGRTADARAHYETLLKGEPTNGRAHYALAILSRQTAASNHVPRLEKALGMASNPDDALRIRYALAKELEDLGDAAASFTHLAAANARQKQILGYDFRQDAAIFDAIEALFDRGGAGLNRGTGDADGRPIFVVGMPRTGTTLVDRILSSHRDVEAAGELQAMPIAVKRLAGTRSRVVIDPETIMASGSADPAAIEAAYLERASHHRSGRTARFTDKLPANFLYIGHIVRALPNARIVCLRRNPMDTIWSNYKNLFASQSAYYAYSYDVMDIARYYARFDRLMAMWDRLWPGRVLQLSYEGLVADQEGQTRRLLDHCGLDWDDACLSFHRNEAAVATPSAAQVRRPINADAVGRWKAHADALEPARLWLQSQDIAVD
ncbi:tetratricopeptide (TPR) repeat protein [Sphingobium fontiphilum]|uniref:Tetratricopeptide (TPR) repeat protein n=1 Tax=Sphingobium fontiphilum TaxID=944425 RepID=A0A7W6DH26_9SPHN|nr:sulfotransferase [Sphingobium fontiphilum]MBB3980517.1 tetratricopeptide (TPR) repeat protein [Sphingobium fontiphilum]